MKNYKKIGVLFLVLITLTGCTNVIDPSTKKVMEQYVIRLGDSWIWGKEGWFASLFIWPLAQLVNFFAQYTGALLSIVIVTLLTRLVTLRGSIKSTVQQQKMQLMAPEQAKIEEKYRNRTDQQSKMAKATEIQKLYEKHGVNPMGAIGSMFIQLPIILAMYQAVTRSYAIITGSVLGQPLEITPREGIFAGNIVVIVIFALMIVAQASSMFIPQYLAKRKLKKYPNQKEVPNQAQSMMYVSLAMVVVFALNMNVGMSLYWLVSSVTQLAQTLYINHKYGSK